MSLDEIIKQSKGNRKKNFNKGGRGSRNFNDRRRYNDKGRADRKELKEEKTERRTKLFVSNLQKDIVNSELRVFFIYLTYFRKSSQVSEPLRNVLFTGTTSAIVKALQMWNMKKPKTLRKQSKTTMVQLRMIIIF
jgi:hypothetical protein